MVELSSVLSVSAPALAVALVMAGRHYARRREIRRGVREELIAELKANHPDVEVLGEARGNLILRMADNTERMWAVAPIYSEVTRLLKSERDGQQRGQPRKSTVASHLPPPLDASLRAYVEANGLFNIGGAKRRRGLLCRRAVASLFAPEADATLSVTVHGEYVKPMLVPQSLLAGSPEATRTPLPELGLAVVYLLDLPQSRRYLTEQDRGALGISVEDLHQLALANLNKDFPEAIVPTALHTKANALLFLDSFGATRLLLIPERLQAGQELVASIPHRDMLMLLPGSMRADREMLRKAIISLERQATPPLRCDDHPPLMQRPVLVTCGGFEAV